MSTYDIAYFAQIATYLFLGFDITLAIMVIVSALTFIVACLVIKGTKNVSV